VYAFGLLALTAVLLFWARTAILTYKHTPLSRAIHFLYREFEPCAFWWELCEMVRRLTLVGIFVVIEQGSLMQLMIGTAFSACYMLLQMQAGPYAETSSDYLANGCSFALLVFFLCCISFKMGTLTELQAVQKVMSAEQMRSFRISTLALSVGLVVSVVSVLFISFLILVVQLRNETLRIRRDARSAKARRLRDKASGAEITVPPTGHEDGELKYFHVFLSHVWGTGQDQMRIIKQRLTEMVPDMEVFLDVDDLKEIGDLEGYIDRSSTCLVCCSKGYFASKNCIRELVCATFKDKPIATLVDPDLSRGGMSFEQIHEQLIADDDMFEKWGFRSHSHRRCSTSEWHGHLVWPGGQQLYDALFDDGEPIEWNRLGFFQDVTMRLIAERLLYDAAGTTYVDGELISRKLRALPPPQMKHKYHVCCSERNPGALGLVTELSEQRGIPMQLDSLVQPRTRTRSRRRRAHAETLCVTTNVDRLAECDHLLLYLTSLTWTRGEASEALAGEVMRAMDLGVHVLLTHEMPGVGGQDKRFGCDFGSFFACVDGATPELLLKRGIYSEIAVSLKGGPWREASMALLNMEFGLSKEEAMAQAAGKDVLSDVLSDGLGFAKDSLYFGVSAIRGGDATSQYQIRSIRNVRNGVTAIAKRVRKSVALAAAVSKSKRVSIQRRLSIQRRGATAPAAVSSVTVESSGGSGLPGLVGEFGEAVHPCRTHRTHQHRSNSRTESGEGVPEGVDGASSV